MLWWTRHLLVVAVVCPTDCNPTNAAVTPNTSEATVSLWFPLDTATSNLGSQVAEVKETVPAGTGILPQVNHLHVWDPRVHESYFQVISTSFQHSKCGLEAVLLSLMKLLIRLFQARQRILNASIFTLTWQPFCWQQPLTWQQEKTHKRSPEGCFAKTGLTNFKNMLEEVEVIWVSMQQYHWRDYYLGGDLLPELQWQIWSQNCNGNCNGNSGMVMMILMQLRWRWQHTVLVGYWHMYTLLKNL